MKICICPIPLTLLGGRPNKGAENESGAEKIGRRTKPVSTAPRGGMLKMRLCRKNKKRKKLFSVFCRSCEKETHS